jgi:branched-chain amino acid transport system permease protein
LQFRALADNPTQLALFGYNIRRLRFLAFGIAGLLAATSSLLVAFDLGFDPHGGLNALLLAIVAVIIGGRESLFGPVLAGFLLGVMRAQIVWYGSARWQDTVTYLLLVLFLFLRPQGLIGKKNRLEAQA